MTDHVDELAQALKRARHVLDGHARNHESAVERSDLRSQVAEIDKLLASFYSNRSGKVGG